MRRHDLTNRPWPQTEKWEFHYGGMFFYCHYTYKCPGKCLQPSKKWFSCGALHLKKMARVAWKMAPKYQKNAKWQKITFWGRILVPEVAFLGVWGVPKMALRVPQSKFRDHFSIQTSPKKPPQEPKSALEKCFLAILHFLIFWRHFPYYILCQVVPKIFDFREAPQ